jgi:hypothetical protein
MPLFIMRVANSCLIWKVWVNKGTIDVPSSFVVIRMRDGSTLVVLSRETTSICVGKYERRILTNKVLLVGRFLSVQQSLKEWELILLKEHQCTL